MLLCFKLSLVLSGMRQVLISDLLILNVGCEVYFPFLSFLPHFLVYADQPKLHFLVNSEKKPCYTLSGVVGSFRKDVVVFLDIFFVFVYVISVSELHFWICLALN